MEENEIILPLTPDELLSYYEETGIMKDYYIKDKQAERDEATIWDI